MDSNQTEQARCELDDLIFELLDGDITPERHQLLQSRLQADPAARRRYLDLASLDNLLELHNDGGPASYQSAPQNLIPFDRLARKQRQRIALWSAATAAAVLLVCGIILTVINVSVEPWLASLQYAPNTDFKVTHPEGGYEQDTLVAGSRVEVRQGSLQLDLANGVKAVVQAPALFTMTSGTAMELQSGNAWYTVSPEGHGFTVNTPQMEIVDLGTEFGVMVDPSTAQEQVHVLRGRVQVRALHRLQEHTLLTAGKACEVDASGSLVEVQVDSARFLQGLPDGLTYLEWNFDDTDDSEITPQGTMSGRDVIRGSVVRGKIKKVKGVSGKARKFENHKGYIQTTWPGVDADRPRTISAWVRYPKEPVSNGAVIEWGIPQLNAAKWRITVNPNAGNGNYGALRTEFGFGYVIGSTDLRDGKWHHIVSVYDGSGRGDAETIKLYVDGKREKISGSKVNRVGTLVGRPGANPCLIGKDFRGAIDSLRVYQGAYPAEDIPSLMKKD